MWCQSVLAPPHRQQLNRLQPHSGGAGTALWSGASRESAKPDVPEQITARLKGQFRGWTGDTVFRLDNGQVWQQRVGGKYRGKKLTDPEVIVQRGRWGYYLKVVGVKRTIGVRRLQVM